MKVLRTPDDRFANLVDHPFDPHYAEVTAGDHEPLRMHYLDEGPADAAPVLLLHGEPTWSYLYRHMIPVLTAAGHRVVAPDLVGFGRSDKPADPADYSFARLVAWTSALLFDHLDLRDITYFGQDWGALVGLRLVAADPDRYARVAIGNGGLPTGEGTPTEAFLNWQRFAQTSPSFKVGRIISGGTVTPLDDITIAAYDAPFPDKTYMAGARTLPSLVPTSADDPAHDDNVAAWEVLGRFDKPFLCTFSDSDAITKGGDAVFLRKVPGTKGQAHTTIEGGGHFLQEDRGPELARILNEFIAAP
ncbi:MAG: haloalkane dehalogenase [Acidimicrobiia bacterium]|nr:haloalkane dehalogenase [Acidimicrobiia bacterium]